MEVRDTIDINNSNVKNICEHFMLQWKTAALTLSFSEFESLFDQ